jgi:pimeloyl-ACP methyl ester carboxylesterase
MKSGRLSPAQMYPVGTGTVQARFIVLRSGARVRIAECGPEDGAPILMLHGWGGSIYGFRKNMPTLGAAGYRAIAADLLGHGLSDKPLDVGRYTFAGQIAQVVEVMDALAIEEATLVGQSMGGELALGFTKEHPSRVSAVAVINASGLGRIPGIHTLRFLARIPPALHMPITSRRFMVRGVLKYAHGRLGFTERDVDEYWAPSQFPEWGRVLVMLLRVGRWDPVPSGEFAELSQPTLVIVSTSDRVVCVENDEALRNRIPPASTVVRIPEGGHLVNEELPDPVNAALLAFLDEAKLLR